MCVLLMDEMRFQQGPPTFFTPNSRNEVGQSLDVAMWDYVGMFATIQTSKVADFGPNPSVWSMAFHGYT